MDAEPEITIYGEQWVQAVHRVDALPLDVRGAFARMLVTMEEGWAFARPMKAVVEAGAPRDGYTHSEVVYYAAEVLIVDLFRTLALEMERAVPDLEAGHGPDVMLDDMETESELLMRYLVLTEATPPATRRLAGHARGTAGPGDRPAEMDARFLDAAQGDGGRAGVARPAGTAQP